MPLIENQNGPGEALTGLGTPLDARTAQTSSTYRRTFLVMCVFFGLNHAAVTTPIGYSTSLLGSQVGSASLATLYGVCLISSLFFGPLFTSSLGPRNALVLGMLCYVIYVFCFALAISTAYTRYFDPVAAAAAGCDLIGNVTAPPGQNCAETVCHTSGWILAIGGAVIGGIGAGSLWTAQGAFFAAICESLSEVTQVPLQALTAELSSSFAIWYLGQECVWKALFTVLTKYLSMSWTLAFVLYGILSLIATVGMAMGQDARQKNATASAPFCARAASAFRLWPDPTVWLLSGLNFTFGFAAAYLGGYVNANWEAEALSPDFIGFLGAIICLIAAVSSKVYGVVATIMGTKLPIVAFGCFCFFTMAILSFITAPDGKGPGGWGWGIVVFYILQGMGRGVYESTNKGIFADYFQGEKAAGAFANCMMQSTGASTIGYIMGSFNADQYEVWPLLIFAVVTVPMLVVADCMRNPQSDKTSDPQ